MQLLAPEDDLPYRPSHYSDLQGIRAVTLAELITMKLSTGTAFVHRAQDLADVIRLIDEIPLDKKFTPKVDKAYRAEFEKLIDDLNREQEAP